MNTEQIFQRIGGVATLVLTVLLTTLFISWIVLPWTISNRLNKLIKEARQTNRLLDGLLKSSALSNPRSPEPPASQ